MVRLKVKVDSDGVPPLERIGIASELSAIEGSANNAFRINETSEIRTLPSALAICLKAKASDVQLSRQAGAAGVTKGEGF